MTIKEIWDVIVNITFVISAIVLILFVIGLLWTAGLFIYKVWQHVNQPTEIIFKNCDFTKDFIGKPFKITLTGEKEGAK